MKNNPLSIRDAKKIEKAPDIHTSYCHFFVFITFPTSKSRAQSRKMPPTTLDDANEQLLKDELTRTMVIYERTDDVTVDPTPLATKIRSMADHIMMEG